MIQRFIAVYGAMFVAGDLALSRAIRDLLDPDSSYDGLCGIWEDNVNASNVADVRRLPALEFAIDACAHFPADLVVPRIDPFLSNLAFVRLLLFTWVPVLSFDVEGLTRDTLREEVLRRKRFSENMLPPPPPDTVRAVRIEWDNAWDNDMYDFVEFEQRYKVVCEVEGDYIREGLIRAEKARRKELKLGSPQIEKAREAAREAHFARRPGKETMALVTRLRKEGRSLRAIAGELNDGKIKPPRGRQWYASSVRNLLVSRHGRK
jgi:hypothetical protein